MFPISLLLDLDSNKKLFGETNQQRMLDSRCLCCFYLLICFCWVLVYDTKLYFFINTNKKADLGFLVAYLSKPAWGLVQDTFAGHTSEKKEKKTVTENIWCFFNSHWMNRKGVFVQDYKKFPSDIFEAPFYFYKWLVLLRRRNCRWCKRWPAIMAMAGFLAGPLLIGRWMFSPPWNWCFLGAGRRGGPRLGVLVPPLLTRYRRFPLWRLSWFEVGVLPLLEKMIPFFNYFEQ